MRRCWIANTYEERRKAGKVRGVTRVIRELLEAIPTLLVLQARMRTMTQSS